MCGRYSLDDITNRFASRFKVANYIGDIKPRYNVAPQQAMPVIISKKERGRQLRIADAMQWGLIPSWTKDLKKAVRPINAKAETVGELPSFRGPFRQKRCLVPASSFFEWQQSAQGKVPYLIHLKGEGLFAFAGIYDEWFSPDGSELRTYCIITTEPNSLMEGIHNRMPVILRPGDEDLWLSSGVNPHQLAALLKPYNAEEMEAYPVSTLVNKPQNDFPEIIRMATQ